MIFRGISKITPNKKAKHKKTFSLGARVSGGHLCEAEAPTEPVGETGGNRRLTDEGLVGKRTGEKAFSLGRRGTACGG